jgi:hypothetical protein
LRNSKNLGRAVDVQVEQNAQRNDLALTFRQTPQRSRDHRVQPVPMFRAGDPVVIGGIQREFPLGLAP